MKKSPFVVGVLAVAASLTVACESGKKSPDAVESVAADTLETSLVAIDSLAPYQSEDEWTSYYMEGADVQIEVPSFEQNPVLANAIMEWVSDNLDSHYTGDLKDVEAFLEDLHKEQAEQSLTGRVRKVYETPSLVTFVLENSIVPVGAAHGTTTIVGATFRKSDGKRFGSELLDGTADLQPFVKKGLKEYFEVKTDDALVDCLFLDDSHSIDYLPLPDTDPWVEKDGVVFLYQAYEIACYAAGMPSFTVPLEQIEASLTPISKRLLNSGK